MEAPLRATVASPKAFSRRRITHSLSSSCMGRTRIMVLPRRRSDVVATGVNDVFDLYKPSFASTTSRR